jgi:hypothetical protein
VRDPHRALEVVALEVVVEGDAGRLTSAGEGVAVWFAVQ